MLAAGLSVGCASPGPPRPPSLHLPEIPLDLAGERVGNEVRLRWTTSKKTTDELGMVGAMTAQVCREVVPASGMLLESCASVRRVPVAPGASVAVDRLPAPFAQGDAMALAYRVEVRNSKERSAGLSAPVYVAGGVAPPAVSQLQAEATERGALLRWKAEDAADTVELERAQIAAPRTAAKDQSKAVFMRFEAARGDAPGTPFVPDAGGMVDTTARRGESYTYTAQRVRHVMVGGHALELRSAACAPVTVTMRDTFAPRPPDGVEAIATVLGGATVVDLTWKPNTEDDLAGYLVYRQQLSATGESGSTVRLTASPLPRPAFRDASVVAGRTYIYTVAAVDAAGNESGRSAPAREEIAEP